LDIHIQFNELIALPMTAYRKDYSLAAIAAMVWFHGISADLRGECSFAAPNPL
jgi:hypothetical protein